MGFAQVEAGVERVAAGVLVLRAVVDDRRDGGELVREVGELDFAEAGRRGGVDGGEGGFGDAGKLEGQVSDEDPYERARIH